MPPAALLAEAGVEDGGEEGGLDGGAATVFADDGLVDAALAEAGLRTAGSVPLLGEPLELFVAALLGALCPLFTGCAPAFPCTGGGFEAAAAGLEENLTAVPTPRPDSRDA